MSVQFGLDLSSTAPILVAVAITGNCVAMGLIVVRMRALLSRMEQATFSADITLHCAHNTRRAAEVIDRVVNEAERGSDAMLHALNGGAEYRASAILVPAPRGHCDVCRKRLDRAVVNDCVRADCPCQKGQAA